MQSYHILLSYVAWFYKYVALFIAYMTIKIGKKDIKNEINGAFV